MSTPSPVYLHCERLGPPKLIIRRGKARTSAGEEFLCRWRVRSPFAAARFLDRAGRGSAIIHPSPKKPGRWQVSFFDAQGEPYADSERETVEQALAVLHHSVWRLAEVSR